MNDRNDYDYRQRGTDQGERGRQDFDRGGDQGGRAGTYAEANRGRYGGYEAGNEDWGENAQRGAYRDEGVDRRGSQVQQGGYERQAYGRQGYGGQGYEDRGFNANQGGYRMGYGPSGSYNRALMSGGRSQPQGAYGQGYSGGQQGGYSQGGYDRGGYDQDNFAQGGYESGSPRGYQAGFDQQGYGQRSGYTMQNEYGQGDYGRQGGYGGYGQQGGYDQRGYGQREVDRGGFGGRENYNEEYGRPGTGQWSSNQGQWAGNQGQWGGGYQGGMRRTDMVQDVRFLQPGMSQADLQRYGRREEWGNEGYSAQGGGMPGRYTGESFGQTPDRGVYPYSGSGSQGQFGMRGRHSGRGPKGYQRSDDRIREDVCETLTHHGEIDASEIEIDVRAGEVTLRGTVEDRWQKRLAEDVIESISGVKDVRNEIRVNRSGSMSGSSSFSSSTSQMGQTAQRGTESTSGMSTAGSTGSTSGTDSQGERASASSRGRTS